jgi:hypothetical protein
MQYDLKLAETYDTSVGTHRAINARSTSISARHATTKRDAATVAESTAPRHALKRSRRNAGAALSA